MRVTPPITITDAMLTSNIAEPDTGEATWNAATNYATGQVAIRTTTHRRYERLAPGGVDATLPENAPTLWADAGPTNRWAMIDRERSSQTTSSSAIVLTLAPGQRITSLGLTGLYGSAVTVEMHHGATLIYTRTLTLLRRSTTTWRQYYYGAFRVRSAVALYDLPLDSAATITITITPYSGSAKCGSVVIGTDEYLGFVIDEPVSDRNNFSKVDRDAFAGISSLSKRPGVPVLNYRLRAPLAMLDRLVELRDELDAVPALYSGIDDQTESPFFQTMLVLGFAKKFSISMRATHVQVELNLEEL